MRQVAISGESPMFLQNDVAPYHTRSVFCEQLHVSSAFLGHLAPLRSLHHLPVLPPPDASIRPWLDCALQGRGEAVCQIFSRPKSHV